MNDLASLIKWLVEAQAFELDAEVVTAPAVLEGDGSGASTYACDIRISGQSEIIRNVPIASGTGDVRYATIGNSGGSAVRVAKNPTTGKLSIVGFSKTKPGIYHRYSLNLATGVNGAVENETITVRKLTYGELATYGGGFGVCPYGAYGIFRGGTLIEVRT